MADILADAATALRMDQIDVNLWWAGTVIQHSDAKITIDIGGSVTEQFSGFGFTYDDLGNPLSGILTGLKETALSQTAFTITGLDTAAVAFDGWADSHNTSAALADMLAGNDNITGSQHDDYLVGLSGHDILIGGGGADGADNISGGSGMDYLQGNAGNDTLDGGAGPDRINGGADDDRISGGADNDIVNGNLGNDTIDGGAGNDSLRGGQGDDDISGGDGDDTLLGDIGNDILHGNNGNDLLQGGDYGDTLTGDAGNDTITGGHMVDSMTGGEGADLFFFDRYAGRAADGEPPSPFRILFGDIITDFTHGVDHIGFEYHPTALLFGTAGGSESAGELAHSLLTTHAGYGEVALIQVRNDTDLYASGDGTSDGVDLLIRLDGVQANALTLDDFV